MTEPIPLELLCGMAWRIVPKEDDHKITQSAWTLSLHWADWMIREAYRVRETKALEEEVSEEEWQERWRTRKTILEPLLTEAEKKSKCVEFGRGCQLITGQKKRSDAALKVQRAWEEFLQYPWEGYERAQKYGWRIDRLAEAYVKYQSIPKHLLRKPYEKSGSYKKDANKNLKK
jgi:hypothetical protein